MTPALLLLLAAAPPAAPPDPVLAFARSIPRITSAMQDYVATETMTQRVMDPVADRPMRKTVLVSDYQIAPLDEDPAVLWEFRFVREADGKPVPGADRQIEDFFRLRSADAREERARIAKIGQSRSLPGCYWHNLTLLLQGFQGGNVLSFDWTPEGEGGFRFQQARGRGIPEDLFDPRSPRHFPTGKVTLAGGALSRLEISWASGETVTDVTLEFAPPDADGVIHPARYVARRRLAGPGHKTALETIFEYSGYRKFTVTTEPKT
jgi:hypothetical protein